MAQRRGDRQKAAALGAVDAKELIATIPGLAAALSPAQVEHIQNLLDAAVLNPVLKKEADDLYRQSVTHQIGSQVNRDPEKVEKAQRVYDKMILVSEQDYHIRLDINKLLTADALTPRTDNPDEVNYLAKVRNTLAGRGIWLRVTQPYVRDVQDPSSHVKDPRKWQLWFSLGYDGDEIPTKDGKIDRDELLSTTMLGAGYYTAVHTGYVQTKLKAQMARLSVELDDGIEEHERLIKRYRDAFPGVAEISDFLGGAELPSRSIWTRPRQLYTKALYANVGGNVLEAQVYLVVAAIIVQANAESLAVYYDRSASGAGTAVKILKVAKTAGEIAEAALILTGIGAVVRGGRAVKGGANVAAELAERKARDEAAEKLATEYAKKNGIPVSELSVPKYVPQPKGSVAGYRKGGHSSGAGTGWHEW
ncbi:MAG: hypothetical protein QUS14_09080 [Pyrinomonadaceae bacterium]|nr:hypothetical protein [Pyrinomonadaceae bacterium]